MAKEKYYKVVREIPPKSVTYLKSKSKIELIASQEFILRKINKEELRLGLIHIEEHEKASEYE